MYTHVHTHGASGALQNKAQVNGGVLSVKNNPFALLQSMGRTWKLMWIESVISSAYYHLKNIARVRGIMSKQDLETLIHAFVSSRLDYCKQSP